MTFWSAMQLASFILGWLGRASADGEIDEDEMLELVRAAATMLGLKVRIKVPAPPVPEPAPLAPSGVPYADILGMGPGPGR